MSGATSKRLRTFSATILLVGLVTAAVAFTLNQVRKTRQVLAFTIVSKRTFTPGDGGEPRQELTMTRYQKSDGTWKQVVTYLNPDGTVAKNSMAFGQPGRGVFQVDEAKKEMSFVSPMEKPIAELPLSDLRGDPGFVKKSSVLGYETSVLRSTEEDGSGDYEEVYYAPAFHNLSLKTVSFSKRGISTLEAVKIEIGEPAAQEFSSLPDWDVKYDRFQEKIKVLEDRGRQETAEQMRQELQKRLQQKPER
jgi:hypothetical protein